MADFRRKFNHIKVKNNYQNREMAKYSGCSFTESKSGKWMTVEIPNNRFEFCNDTRYIIWKMALDCKDDF